MKHINVTNFRQNIFDIISQTIQYNEPVHVTTKDGGAVILSEEDYNGLMETLYLTSIPSLKKQLMDGLHTPLEECLSEHEVGF